MTAFLERLNVSYLALCFMVLFSSDFTMNYLQKTISSSIREEKPSYRVDGYITLAVTYFVYGVSLWLAPSILAVTGPRILFVCSSIFYALHPLSFMAETVWVTYTVLCLAGMAGSLLWVSHGSYLVNSSSSSQSLATNIALFWAIFSMAMIPGNVFAAVRLEGKQRLDVETRTVVLSVLTAIALAATVMFAFLRSAPAASSPAPVDDTRLSLFQSLTTTWRVFTSTEMLVLVVTFIYTGFQQAFGNGVMGASIGFTSDLGPSNKQLIPISALCYGAGEITGSIAQMISSRLGSQWRRSGPLLAGVSLQLIAYAIFAATLPDSSVFADTVQPSLLQQSRWRLPMILTSSALVGLGDSTLNAQIYPLIADLHPGLSAHSCALYKFTKSMAMAAYFVGSSKVGLHAQTCVLGVAGAAGVAAYLSVDLRRQAKPSLV